MNERKYEMEIEIAATPEEVWQALSTAEGFKSWFAPIAEVTPGVGGAICASWEPAMGMGKENIEIWEPGKHLRITHDRSEGAPPSVVDYLLEGRGGSTVLRLVHSGFGAAASFDNELESTRLAWPVFLKMMKHSVERGIAGCRNITVFRMLSESRDACVAKLMGPKGLCAEGTLDGLNAGDTFHLRAADGQELRGVVTHNNPAGYFCFELPQAGDRMLAIFCENCGGAAMLTTMWLLYDVTDDEAEQVRRRWSALVDGLFEQAVAAGKE
jgi:uncharacterized protein YndB with AHSA1/START domain